MDQIVGFLQAGNFLQNAILLIFGAILTGIMVPLIKARLNHASFKRREIFEAQLARQADVIKAQTEFLKEFSRYIWEFHRLCQQVSFSRLHREKEDFDKVVNKYHEEIWDLLHCIRSVIGAARWFTSDAAHSALCTWYEEWFIGISGKIELLMTNDSSIDEWSAHHLHVHQEAPKRNYGIFKYLGTDFGITSIVEGGESGHSYGAA